MDTRPVVKQPRVLEPSKVTVIDSEATCFCLDEAGNWTSGDAFWIPVTGRSFEESVGTGWIDCLDPVAYVDLHKGFVELVTQGVALHRPVIVKRGGQRLRPAFLSLTRSEVGGRIKGVLSLTKLQPSASPPRRMLPPEEDPLSRMNRRLVPGVQLLGAMIVLCALVGVIAVSSRMKEGGERHQETSLNPVKLSGDSLERKVEKGRRLVYRYHEAPSVRERAAMVLGDPQAMEQKLLDHEAPVYPIARILRSEVVTFNQVPHLVVQGTDSSKSRFLDVVDLSGESPKLNWEATIGFCEVPLEQFRVNPPADPVVMRLLIRPDNYHNHEFADSQHWASYYVSDRTGEDGVFAYAEHGSSVHGVLQELFSHKAKRRFVQGLMAAEARTLEVRPRRVTVRLAPGKWHSNQVRIVEILGQEWVSDPGALAGRLAEHSLD